MKKPHALGLLLLAAAFFVTPFIASAANTLHATCANATENAQVSCTGDVFTYTNSSSLGSVTVPYVVASGVTYYVSFTTTQTSCNSSCVIRGYFTGEANDTTNQLSYQPPGSNVRTAVPVLTTRTNTTFRLEAGTGPINKWGGSVSNFCITDTAGDCEAPPPVLGCTDPEAENYDPEATEDDGSCTYPEPPVVGGGGAGMYSTSTALSQSGDAALDFGRMIALVVGIALGAIAALIGVRYFQRKVSMHISGRKF